MADAYGDGGFFFTQPVGRPTGGVEPGSGHPDPNNSVTASIPFGQGGPFDNELVQTNTNYTRTTYGDGGFYFLSPVNTPNYSGPTFAGRAALHGFRHPSGYGVANVNLKSQLGSGKVKSTKTVEDVKTKERTGRKTETKRGEATASAAQITDYQNALKAQGKAEFWVTFWTGSSNTSGRGMTFGGGEKSSATKTETTRATTALRTAQERVASAKQTYLSGLPADVVANVAFADALAKFEKTYIRKGWLDEAFLGLKSDGKRKVSDVAVAAIKRDVFEAYATRASTFDQAMALAKQYILGTAQYQWKYEKAYPGLGLSEGFVKDNFGEWKDTPYGVFENSREVDGQVFPGKNISKSPYKREVTNTYSVATDVDEASYSGGIVWWYETDKALKYIKKFQQADRYWLIRRKLFEDKALLEGTTSALGSLRVAQENERKSVNGSLTSILNALASARKTAVEAQISVEQAELDKQAAARLAVGRRTEAQTAANVVKGHALTAATKRAAAETAASAMDVTTTTTAAGEADTAAKTADGALAAVREKVDATKTANTASGSRANAEVTAAEAAYTEAQAAAAQALADANSATLQIEVATRAKEAFDKQRAEDAALTDLAAIEKRLNDEKLKLAQGLSTQAIVDELQRQYDAAKKKADEATAASNTADQQVDAARVEAQEAKTPPEPVRESLIGKPKMDKVGFGPSKGAGEGLSTTVKVALGVGVLAAAGGAYWWFKIRPKGVK
jgi:hypothetical protein